MSVLGSIRVHSGSFGEGTDSQFAGTSFIMKKRGYFFSRESIPASQVSSFEVLAAGEQTSMKGAAAYGVLGGVTLGPLGALAGAFLGGRTHQVLFRIKFRDGRGAVCSADFADVSKMLAVLPPKVAA